jgi:hypothetical protein
MKIVIILCAIVCCGVAEKPAPYPARGWKPQGARLELPRVYGPAKDVRNVEFTTLTNEYIPPATEATLRNSDSDFLQVQGLPAANSASQYENFQVNGRARQKSAKLVVPPPPSLSRQPLLLSSFFAPQFARQSGQLQANPKDEVQQIAQQQYGPPRTNIPSVNDPQPQVPQTDDEPELSTEEPESDENDENDEPVIAVSNSEDVQQGQYYILLPDNSLQKVRFATGQTAEDRQLNGFSAQLRYFLCKKKHNIIEIYA